MVASSKAGASIPWPHVPQSIRQLAAHLESVHFSVESERGRAEVPPVKVGDEELQAEAHRIASITDEAAREHAIRSFLRAAVVLAIESQKVAHALLELSKSLDTAAKQLSTTDKLIVRRRARRAGPAVPPGNPEA